MQLLPENAAIKGEIKEEEPSNVVSTEEKTAQEESVSV